MSGPLVVTEQHLARHFSEVEIALRAIIATSEINIAVDWNSNIVAAGLVGQNCERVSRNRGADADVAPLLQLDSELWAWLGFREEWPDDTSSKGKRKLLFRSSNLTVHFGLRNIRHKPQMFRAEWAGWGPWNGPQNGFQASNAAHPHWQFDALDSLQTDEAETEANTFLDVLRAEAAEAGPEDFIPHSVDADEISGIVGSQELSRVHFPSAAAWWKAPPHNDHAHVPASTKDIQVWIERSLEYTLEELRRLQPNA